MTIRINPKLLDVVQLAGSPFKAGETQSGTIVELLGGTPEMALIEVLDEQGVPLAFVRRTIEEEVEGLWEGIKLAKYDSKIPDAQLSFESGILFLQNGWYKRAKEQFVKSFSLDPHFRGLLLNTTNQLAKTGAFETAIFVYTMLLELSPDYQLARENFAIALMNRAIAFARRGLFPQAMETFLKALALHPSMATAQMIRNNIAATYTQLALLYSNTNQHQLALQYFQRAFELDPSEISRKNLGVAMIAVYTVRSGILTTEARAEMFRQPLLMGLTLSECLTAYGATLATLGEIAEARRVVQEAVDADPRDMVARHNLEVVSAPGSSAGLQAGLVPIENQTLEGIRL
jgi:tetratricopeptide (TPR) repeat protein